ncbi:MAG: CIA30 family protein [Sulfitobacter sp.]
MAGPTPGACAVLMFYLTQHLHLDLMRYLHDMKNHIAFGLIALAPIVAAQETQMILTPNWEYVADQVMGGVSTGQITARKDGNSSVTRLTGDVSLENNGGFVQMAFDLLPGGATFDASQFSGIEIVVRGNGETYDLRLRTDQLARPWHSYRTEFVAPKDWHTLRMPFESFAPHRTDVVFDQTRLRRIGVLAIGRTFRADISVARISFY